MTEAFCLPLFTSESLDICSVSSILAAPALLRQPWLVTTCPWLCQSPSMVLWEVGHWAVTKYH